MRELHDGIALLEEERDAGPFVWRNWDKWVERCERVVNFVDRLVLDGKVGSSAVEVAMKKRGLVCGVEWEVFRRTVEKYRRWLETQYGGPAKLREELVFAHNDVSPPSCSQILVHRTKPSEDAIRQHPPPQPARRIALTPPRQRTQTTRRHRLRIRQRQHARP